MGSTLIILLYILLVIRCLIISTKQREIYKKYICVGIGAWIATQSFVNMGVATSLIPNTGVPLPFVSYGGSSLLTNFICIGLILNISARRQKAIFIE